jgi:proteasome assembly chaperone (PAC2) family protein
MREQLKFSRQPDFEKPTLMFSWIVDARGLGEQVSDYLNHKLNNESFCDIEPDDFFPLHGVNIQNDTIQFPESRFYAGTRKDIIVFQSTPPRFEWYRFFHLILETARDLWHVSEIYTIDSMVSFVAHTAPREILANFSTREMKDDLVGYNLGSNWNYETPPGQRPTLNSFLLWSAQNLHMRAAALWVPTPFYLATVGDPKAQLRVLEFLNGKFNLCMDLSDLDQRVRSQNRMIVEACQATPEIDRLIKKVEVGDTLSPEESQQLVMDIEKQLSVKQA